MISNDDFGLYFRMGQSSTEKRFGTCPVAFVAQEHTNHLSVFVYSTIHVEFLLPPKAEHFVDRPVSAAPPPVLIAKLT